MAGRSVGSIQIDLDAMIARFDKNMDRANKRLDKIEGGAKKAAAAAKKAAEAAEKSWDKAGKAIHLVGGALLAVGAAVASRRVIASLDAAADKVVDLGKKSHALGIPVEKLSELRFAAEESNVSFEALTQLLSTATRNLGEFAGSGGGPAAKTIADLNLELFDSQGNMRDIVDLLPDLSRKLGGLAKGEQLSAAGKIFGEEGGARFVQMLEDSSSFLDTLAVQQQRAARLGVVFTEEQVQRLTKYTDAVHRMGEAWFGVKVRIIDAIAPELEEFLNLGAAVMAAAPDIVEAIAEAFRSDDPEIERRLNELGESIVRAMGATGSAAGTVLVAGLMDAVTIGVQAIAPSLIAIGAEIFANILDGYSRAYKQVNDGSWGPRMAGLLFGLEAATNIKVAELRSDISPKELMRQINVGMLDRSGLVSPIAMEQGITRIGAAYGQAARNADDLFGIMQKINSRSMDIAARSGGLGGGGLDLPDDPDKTPWEQLLKGINAGYDTLLEKAENFEHLGTASITTFTDTISGDLASALASGEVGLSNFGDTAVEVFEKAAESVLALVLRFYLAQAVLGGLEMIPGIGPAQSSGKGFIYSPSAPITAPQAHGGAWLNGMPLHQFAAGGVVGRPTLFPMSRGMGLMGEAGPEAIMPLTRVGGDLGVRAVGGGVTVQIIDQRGSGEPATVQEQRGPDGRRILRVLIRDEVRQQLGDGAFDKAMGSTYGVRRRGTPR